jgi:hypothetical protein
MPEILTTQKAEIGQKVHETPSQSIKTGHGACACHSSYSGGINRRMVFQANLGINLRSYAKNN